MKDFKSFLIPFFCVILFLAGERCSHGFWDSLFEEKVNVLLITLDTLQAKSLGVYGYPLGTSPNIDALSKEAFVFDNAFVMCNHTAPSHASILSSLHISEHGLINNFGPRINPNTTLLPEILKDNGYKTFASVSTEILDPKRSGLARGFDVYSEHNDPKYKEDIEHVGVRGEGVTNSFIGWFESEKPKKFFAWLHYFDVHAKYIPPPEFNKFTQFDPYKFCWDKNSKNRKTYMKEDLYSKEERKIARALYNGEILYADHEVGRVVDFLKKMKVYNDTLIIITNDHGESIEDHRPFFCHNTLYDEIIKAVLIIKSPDKLFDNIKGRSDVLAASIDIAPTVLDYVGIQIPDDFVGQSLLPDMKREGRINRDYVICETGPGIGYRGYAVIFPDSRYFSYTVDGEAEKKFFNVKKDPGQFDDIISKGPPILKKAEKILDEWKQKGFLSSKIEEPYMGDYSAYHRNFFYLQMNYSREKKIAKFQLGDELKGKDFVLILAESGNQIGREHLLKDDFVKPFTFKDSNFKLSDDYSVRIENANEEPLRLYSKKIPIKFEQTWKFKFDYYVYSLDVFIKDPGVQVKTHFFTWKKDGESYWLKGMTRRVDKSVSEAGKWYHVHYMIHYASVYKAVGMMIEVIGNGKVWIDNPKIRKLLIPEPANPWNDPDLKNDISSNPYFDLRVGGEQVDTLPYYAKLADLKNAEPIASNKGYSVSVHADEENLYFAYEGHPDETLYVELWGYVGNARENMKKADESEVLTETDIKKLKALGYIQ